MGRATKEKKYAIIDVETTGGMHHRDKVIEVAIILTDGREIIDSFQSLVHPERSIPYHITRITGIDDDMVAHAPRFYEIAKDIIEIMDGAIFVAHNVKFDYNFIKEEFKSLGYAFNKKRLCTVKLTRSTMPGLRSYGLDNLIKHFDIEVDARHRAYDDTLATWKIFKTIISDMDDSYHVNQLINEGLDASILPRGMSMDEMHATPETPGVYYLCNEEDDVLYVGKAKNIRSRLFQHFRNLSRKSTNIYAMVHRLHYKETGSELLALLLELYEIKRLKPELNKALRRTDYNYALYLHANAAQGKPRLILNKNNKANDLKYQKLKLYSSKGHAECSLQELLLHHEICIRHAKSRATEFACYCEGSCEEVL
ncbi:MAG: exonuclease domain-containing protein, partial [Bacteroidota bacterium]